MWYVSWISHIKSFASIEFSAKRPNSLIRESSFLTNDKSLCACSVVKPETVSSGLGKVTKSNISTHPPIIMADEPTGALDSKTGLEVLKFLQQLNKEGSTVILITHDNGIAATARRCVRLADGKIIEDHEQEVDWL